MTVARLLAPAPWGEGLTVDEFMQWKVLAVVQVEEKQDAASGASSQRQSGKVVTDESAIQAFFDTA